MLTAGCIGSVSDEIVTELPEDWKTKTQEIVQDFLKKKRRPQYIIDILVNLKMIHKEGSK